MAALQVLWYHSTVFFPTQAGWVVSVRRVTDVLPGVPIFFVISGFLVSASYDRSASVGDYLVRRGLRIYPALWLCFAATVVLLAAYGYVDSALLKSSRAAEWFVGQLAIGKGAPNQVRGFMNSAPNGSLWTISVELGFYLVLPFLYTGAKGRRILRGDLVVFCIGIASLLMWGWARHTRSGASTALQATPLPWLWLFLVGVVASERFRQLNRWIRGRGLYCLGGYLLLSLTILNRGFHSAGYGPETLQAIALIGLGLTVVSLAFTAPALAGRLLKHQDVSYGIYLYHYVVIGVALHSLGTRAFGWRVIFVLLVAGICAAVSWVVVERPAKRLRRPILTMLGLARGAEPAA